jgi:hypothetical protein
VCDNSVLSYFEKFRVGTALKLNGICKRDVLLVAVESRLATALFLLHCTAINTFIEKLCKSTLAESIFS